MAAVVVLATAASNAQTTFSISPSTAAAGSRVAMFGTNASTSNRVTLTNQATHASFNTAILSASAGGASFDVPRTAPEGIYRVTGFDAANRLVGSSTVTIKGIVPEPIEGQWFGLKQTADGNAMNAGLLVFFPKKTPVASGARLPELDFPFRTFTGNIKRVVCRIGIPNMPMDPLAGYWSQNPFGGEPAYVWVIHQSRYPKYLATTPYPTAPPPAPSKNTLCVPEGDTRLAPVAR